MAVLKVKEVIVQGDPETRSGIVDTNAVSKGMVLVLGATGNGYVQPAGAAAQDVLGVALYDAEIGEKVTYVVSPAILRVLLKESMTITYGERVQTGTSAILGVTSYGQVAQLDPIPDAAGANPTKAEYDAMLDTIRSDIGYFLEDKTTGADETAVIKIMYQGRKV